MNELKTKKVLWLEGRKLIHRNFQLEAQKFSLELVTFDCWDDAFQALNENYEEWAAIIIQPHSKLHGGSYNSANQLLPQAFSDINVLNATKGKCIPWYILTHINEKEFIDMILESRSKWDATWPKKYYNSNIEEERLLLFQRIKDQTQLAERVQVRTGTFKSIFETLDFLENKFLNIDVRNILEDILVSLIFGESTIYNLSSIRKIIEYLFHSLIKNGLLPSTLKNESNNINNGACSRLLSGKDTIVDNKKYYVLHPIMNKIMSDNLHKLLKIGNLSSHANTEEENKQLEGYLKIGTNNLLYSCIFALFDILEWFKQTVINQEKNLDNSSTLTQWWGVDEV